MELTCFKFDDTVRRIAVEKSYKHLFCKSTSNKTDERESGNRWSNQRYLYLVAETLRRPRQPASQGCQQVLASAYGGAPRFSCHLRLKFPGLPVLWNFASVFSWSISFASFCMMSQDWSGRMGDL